jgi:hypothetical protein
VDSGVGPNGRDGQPEADDKTLPDAESMRLGRSRVARGQPYTPDDPVRMARPAGSDQGGGSGLIGASEYIGGTPDQSELIGGTPPPNGSDTIDLSPRFRPWSESAAPGNQPQICHFLRSVGTDGKLGDPRRTAVPTHRCAAFGDPLPLSLRQQELVCLQRVHVSCPRYLRGTLLASEAPAAAAASATSVRAAARPKSASAAGFSLTMIVGVALMVLTLLLLVTGVAGRLPFLSNPGPTATAPLIAAGSASASTSDLVTATPSPVAYSTPGPTSTPVVTAGPTPRPTATPAPTATPKPVASATWPPGATASRMNLVVACGDAANCYVYTLRSGAQNGSGVNDTLAGVCRFFGVDINTVKAMNQWLHGGTAVSPGEKLRIPAPTR